MPSIKEIQDTISDWISIETMNNQITGTVDVFNNSPVVVGTGTLFTQELYDNQLISIGGIIYRVQTILNDTNLNLYDNWSDPSQSGVEVNKGITSIVENQNFPRPNNQYITILINPQSRIGMAAVYRPDSVGVSTIVGNREFTVFLQCYGTDSMQILSDLRDSLEKRSVISFFCENHIGSIDTLLISDISQLLDNQFEPRASLDLLFRTSSIVDDKVGLIEEIEGDGQYISNSGQTIDRPFQVQ